MISWLLTSLTGVSLFETLCTVFFMVLVFITVYRKQLSSNDSYRNPSNPNKIPLPSVSINLPKVPTFDSMSQLSLDDCKSALAYSVEVAKGQLEVAKREGSQAWDKYISPPNQQSADSMSATSSLMTSLSAATITNSKGLNILDLVSDDIMIRFISYMTNAEISRLACCSSSLSQVMFSDRIWEVIWMEVYGNMWRSKGITEIRELRRIKWDPFANWGPPAQGWYHFYLRFEHCWVNWLLAGLCTQARCVVGLHGSFYDVTPFLSLHPGSGEVLMEFSGYDSTADYDDIGHSHAAKKLSPTYLLWGEDLLSSDTMVDADDRSINPSDFVNVSKAMKQKYRQKKSKYWLIRSPLENNKPTVIMRALEQERQQILSTAKATEEESAFAEFSDYIARYNLNLPTMSMNLPAMPVTLPAMPISMNLSINAHQVTDFIHAAGSTIFPTNNVDGVNEGVLVDETLEEGEEYLDDADDIEDELGSTNSGGENTHLNDALVRHYTLSQAQAQLAMSHVDDDDNFNDINELDDLPQNQQLQPQASSGYSSRAGTPTVSDTHNEGVAKTRLVPSLAHSYPSSDCCHNIGHKHSGQCRVFYDPLASQWFSWWTCCGVGYAHD